MKLKDGLYYKYFATNPKGQLLSPFQCDDRLQKAGDTINVRGRLVWCENGIHAMTRDQLLGVALSGESDWDETRNYWFDLAEFKKGAVKLWVVRMTQVQCDTKKHRTKILARTCTMVRPITPTSPEGRRLMVAWEKVWEKARKVRERQAAR